MMGCMRVDWQRVVRTFTRSLGLLALTWGLPATSRLPPSSPTVQRLGERMFRQGILPSGRVMQSFVLGDVPGTAFTCASCHLRSGTGAFEDGVQTLPTHAAALFRPYFRNLKNLTPAERQQKSREAAPNRPAYNDATLAIALRAGLDPTGREFNPIMPRYELSDPEMAILIRYLHGLSAEFSPGIDATTLRLATVITDEVSLEDREAMLVPLEAFVRFHNGLPSSFKHWMYRSKAGWDMVQEFRQLSLARWVLKGPASTWPRQLEHYYRQEPVFALVGGISYGAWDPIHAFCERRQIPCILPITDFPVLTDRDWYTLYFSRGVQQEGEAAARHLANLLEPSSQQKIVNVSLATRESALLASGFRQAWRELERQPAQEFPLEHLDPAGVKRLQRLIHREKPAVLLLWTGPEGFPALQEIAESPGAPAIVFMASGYLKVRLWELPESARASTYLTYPFRPPEAESRYLRNTNTSIAEAMTQGYSNRIATRTHSLIQVLNQAITEMEQDFYRDNLLDRIGLLPDQVLADYERLSFGPGQRYASKGCYIMQLTPGPAPSLIKKSGWIVP
jgi:hypothetical protein